MLLQNIAFIAEIAKVKFGHTDDEMKVMLSTILEEYKKSE